MSLSGQLLRGIKWHNYRNLDGVYNPDVAEDHNKMEDIEFYLNFIKDKDANKVHKILEKVRFFDLENRGKLSTDEAKKLLNNDLILKTKKEVSK